MIRQQLLRRVMPALLSIAMVFETIPGSVLAAESTVSEIVSEAEQPAEDADHDETPTETAGAEESVEAEATDGLDAEAADGLDAAEVSESKAALPQAIFQVDMNAFAEGLTGYTYDYTTGIVEAEYVKENPAYAAAVQEAVDDAISVWVGGSEDVSLKDQIKYAWKKYTGSAFADMAEGTEPHDAGLYCLEVSLAAAEGKYTAAEPLILGLEVKPAVISLDVERNVIPGSTVGEVKKENENIGIHVHGASAAMADYIQSIVWKVQYAHADEDSAELAADSAKLLKDKDYLLVANVTLKDAANYVVEKDSFNIVFGDSVDTQIIVTYAAAGGTIGKVYDGSGFAFSADKPEYTAKVVYTGADGAQQELADAGIGTVWCDAEKKEYPDKDFAPVNAGVYYYKLFYTDETGSYADSEAYVRVDIRMADIVVVPQPLTDEVYTDMTAAEVLKEAAYKVYRVQNGTVSTEPEAVNEYFWGTAYTQNMSGTQPYEPVFAMERGEKDADGKLVWSSVQDNELLEKTDDKVSYRIVFTGKKAYYINYNDGSATRSSMVDINSAQGNYCVDITTAAIEKYAQSVQVLDSTLVVIDASKIPAPQGAEQEGTGDGEDFAGPVVKLYDGESLYQTKGDYKKAVVTAASEGGKVPADAASMLVYTWQRADSWDLDEQGRWFVEDWRDVSFNAVDTTSSPYSGNVYRLQISLEDPGKAFRAEPVYRYFVIRPQDVVAVLSGTPSIYADGENTVGDLISGIQNDDAENKETYVDLQIFSAALTEDAQTKKGIVTKGEAPLQNSYVTTLLERAYGRYGSWTKDEFFYVEKKITEGEAAGTWERCDLYEVFEKGTEYRLCFDSPYTNSNYNMGKKLDVHNRVVDDEYYSNESIAVICKDTQALELQISIDESKITGNVKTYDGMPFDSVTALQQLVKVTSVADNKDVTEQVKDKLKYLFYNNDLDLVSDAEHAVHAGSYTIYIMLETDDTYRAASYIVNIPYVIEKRLLIVTPGLREEIPAGMRLYGSTPAIGAIVENYEIAGQAECDKEAKLIEVVSWNVHERTAETDSFNGILKSTERYHVLGGSIQSYTRLDPYFDEWISYSDDYTAESVQAVFTPVRMATAVTDADSGTYNDYRVAVKDQVQKSEGIYSHTITPDEGIPYVYPGQGPAVNGVTEGNFFLFKIYAPGDFREVSRGSQSWEDLDIVYENCIEQAGGRVLNAGWEQQRDDVLGGVAYRPYIIVAFDASAKGAAEFEIVWARDYVEKFRVDMSGCILEADLRTAVAPKSIAFNGVSTKMAVGETQQLDVKLTKAQMGDTILLGYSSSDESVLKVNEDNGFVTALSASKKAVTVEVYPCRLVNGVKTPIEGAKRAKVNIKVSDVAAPKISKVLPKDTTAVVQYTKPVNGYRREIYVLEGKKTVQQFEDAIAEVKNGDFGGFVYTLFVTSEITDKKGVTDYTLNNLTPTTGKASEYTVYVRNVAGLRMLDDGSQVAASHAGAVKTFKTIKSQATELSIYFDENLKGQTAVYQEYDYDEGVGVYRAPIAGKSAKLSVDAKFFEKYSQSYSDDADYIWRAVPLSSDMKKNYTLPKMAYYVTEDYANRLTVSQYMDLSVSARASYFYCADGYYYHKAVIASVDKSGKITFKGKGYVYIIAADMNTGINDVVKLFIDASPTAVTAKAVKMMPGQTISLSGILQYQEKKIKIVDYGWRYADLNTTQMSGESFLIQEDESYEGGRDYYITALKPGAKLEFQVTDSVVAANGGSPVTVKLTASAVEPVKNLKASAVYDDHFKVTFNYPRYAYDFRVELRDARGSVVFHDLYQNYDSVRYDTKSKKYVYELDFDNEEITRLSNYTVSVTAVCSGIASKEAKLKVKTTNIPASYYALEAYDYNQGCVIGVNTDNGSNVYLSDNVVLKTGNTYTLNFYPQNEAAKQRLTDTLTWKSTDTKVASVKANAGTYTAQLKAVKQGETTIEVTSKITKKVIARWRVRINATGEANGYFGENEPYNGKATIGGGVDVNGRDILTITADNAINVTLNKGEEQWFVFTAPAYGKINFSSSSSYWVYDGEGNYIATPGNQILEKNTKRYIRIPNTASRKTVSLSVRFTPYQEVSAGDTSVRGGKTVLFRAPEDNYYTVTLIDGENERSLGNFGLSKDEIKEIYINGSSSKEYVLKITKREPQTAVVGGDGIQVTLGAGEKKWFAITVDKETYYSAFATDSTGVVRAEWYSNIKNGYSDIYHNSDNNFLFNETYVKPGVFYICLSSADATAENPVTLTFHVSRRDMRENLGLGEKQVELTCNETQWYSFTAAEAGDYTFQYTEDVKYSVKLVYTRDIKGSTYTFIYDPTTIFLEAGESIYLRVYTLLDSATKDSPIKSSILIEKKI